jgi:hypothetical protein
MSGVINWERPHEYKNYQIVITLDIYQSLNENEGAGLQTSKNVGILPSRKILCEAINSRRLKSTMRFRRCASPTCERPFQINQFSALFCRAVSPMDKPGKIICPHCGLEANGEIESYYLTHALSPAEEAEFDALNPKPAKDA